MDKPQQPSRFRFRTSSNLLAMKTSDTNVLGEPSLNLVIEFSENIKTNGGTLKSE
ncbi:MAG: hypothetical protein H0A76_09985 [Candidatus Thiodubiliella endoseptemdiera]|uniref:Uncharacterized protein n=1 Tax=Candidatus Thiodubiliella endoseptemdiera TaxID=2738886 RepID=A0A853F3U0_9GAMM|nr:hypothetical protein [Candidatus Thiodubiliella endoseptemdiera]